MALGHRGINGWVRRLKGERVLCVLIGMKEGEGVPSVGAHYGFAMRQCRAAEQEKKKEKGQKIERGGRYFREITEEEGRRGEQAEGAADEMRKEINSGKIGPNFDAWLIG